MRDTRASGSPDERVHDVAAEEDVATGLGLRVVVEGRAVAVFREGDRLWAIDDQCTHAEASLAAGEVCDGEVTCPRHGAIFDLTTGEAIGTPAEEDVATHRVRVVDSRVQVALGPEPA